MDADRKAWLFRFCFGAPWLIFLPTMALALLFIYTPRTFHSDDIGYWMMAQQWRGLFEENPLGTAISRIYHWPANRPTFHPLLAVPVLQVFRGEIDRATVCLGMFFSLVIDVGLYCVFRRLALSRYRAALCTAAVGSLPLFLSQGRFFMAEFPFAAFGLSALAFLLAESYAAFALFYLLALLERPLEGTLLLPAFFLAGLLVGPKGGRPSLPKSIAAAAASLSLTALAYRGIAGSFLPWITRTSFRSNGLHAWRNLKFTPELGGFLARSLFHFYGFTGLAILVAALLLVAAKIRSAPRPFLGHAGLLALLMAVLFVISCFDNGATIAASWRYSLAFVLMVLISGIALLLRYGNRTVAGALTAAFLAANLAVLGLTASGSGILDRWPLAGSARYHQEVLNSSTFSSGFAPMVDEVKRLLPGVKSRIVFVGRSGTLLGSWSNISLRCQEKLHTECLFRIPQNDYLLQIFDRELPDPSLELARYGIGAVIFARTADDQEGGVKPFPSAKFYEALRRGQERRLGLVKVGEITTPFDHEPRKLEVFGIAGR